MATPLNEPTFTSNNSFELDQPNDSTSHPRFSDPETYQLFLNIHCKVIDTSNQLAEMTGRINAIATEWNIPKTSSELRDLLKDIEQYTETLQSYQRTIKLSIIKNPENVIFLERQISGIKILPFNLIPIIKEPAQENISQPVYVNMLDIVRGYFEIIPLLPGLFKYLKFATGVFWFVRTMYYYYWSNGKTVLFEIKLRLIECGLSVKLKNLDRLLYEVILENEEDTTTDKLIVQGKESPKMCQQNDQK